MIMYFNSFSFEILFLVGKDTYSKGDSKSFDCRPICFKRVLMSGRESTQEKDKTIMITITLL